MPSVFPGALDNIASNKTDTTVSATDHPDHHNLLADAVNAIEATLGAGLSNIVTSVGATAPITSTGGSAPTIGVTAAAMTKIDDTNVTLTLGGSPNTSLLAATSITAGWTGQLAVSRGGTGLSSIGTANQILGVNNAASALEYKTLTAGANVTITQGVGTVTIASSNPGGTVTSVGLAMPTQFAVTNSPVTGSGTLTAAWNTQTAKTVLAGPTTGAAAVPTFRALVSGDIPALSYVSSVGATAPITSTGGLTPTIGVTAAALTKTDDTNVTLTLGGSPTTSLLAATSLTLGWTGQLGLTRGGTNASLTATAGAVVYSTSTAFALTAAGTTGQWLRSTGTTAPAWTSPAALTKTDDTNVTLTLGGSASTALLNAASLTLGWTGQLSPARGGTGINNGTRTLTVSTNSGTLSFTNASTTLTIANTGSISGTNTGDVTLATNSGLAFTSGQTGLALGTPSNVTSSSTNSVTTSTHTHAITAGLGFIGNGSAQNQIPVTGATPFTPTWTSISSISGQINHNSTTNLTTGDVHTQYALLAGRTGGQTLIGSTQVGGNLTLQSTSNATKGSLIFGTSRYDELNNRLGINTTPQAPLHVRSSSIIFEDDNTAAAGPFLYITDSGQISAGASATEFALFVAGPGSTNNTQGPYFLARGNNFSRIANQRGLLSFAAGNVTTPVGSDGIIQFITASSEAMRITTTQDVGIGATTVGSRLVVRGSGATSATSALNVTNSAGTSALFVRNDGFVGINTITPNDNLTIDLGSAASPDAGLTISGSTSSVGDIGLKLSNTGAGGRTWYLDSTNDGSGYGGGKLVFVRDVAGLTAMTIDSAGKLGLGTTSPSFDVSFSADAAKTIAIEDSASGVAGWDLTVRAGNTVANTNFTGGQLTLASGRASGSGASSIVLQTGASAASGVLQTLTTRLTINNAGDFTFFDGADFILGTTTGTKIGTATTQKIGFYNATPIVRPTAYTQTYSTADKTVAAQTAAALTNNTGGTVSTTLAAITAGAAYTQADMLAVKNALASLADQFNKLRNDHLDTTNAVNAIIDDLQALGLVG